MDARKLLFQNVCCGVEPGAAAKALGLPEETAADQFAEVGRKLAGHQVIEAMPFVPCQTVQDARTNRVRLLPILDSLNLDDSRLVRVRRVESEIQRQIPR